MSMERFVDFQPTPDDTDGGNSVIDRIEKEYPEAAEAFKRIGDIFEAIGEEQLEAMKDMSPEERSRIYTEAGFTDEFIREARDAISTIPDWDGDKGDLFWHGRIRTVEEVEKEVKVWEELIAKDPGASNHPHYLAEKARLEELRARATETQT